MQKCLHDQIGIDVEAYVNEVVIKTRNEVNLLFDLEQTFANLRRLRMKLNPDKCVFDVPLGKLLGFIISQRGIEANPEGIKAIVELEPPKTKREF